MKARPGEPEGMFKAVWEGQAGAGRVGDGVNGGAYGGVSSHVVGCPGCLSVRAGAVGGVGARVGEAVVWGPVGLPCFRVLC